MDTLTTGTTLRLVCAVALVQCLGAARARAQDDAYLDAGARELVRLARERRNSVDRSITGYTTIVQERISGGIRTVGRERLFYRRETAGRIDWRRDGPVRIDVLGAREVVPSILRKAQVPADLRGFMPHLAFDPMDSEMLVRLDTTFLRHPLAAGSEDHYRYRSGDTTTIRLPDGREVRLIELVVIPRRDDIHLLTGSFWLEAATHAVVRVVFRPARAFDFDRDADEDEDDVPGFLKPIRAELLYITLEYGLWELHWWLPRTLAAEGAFQISFLTMPLKYERRYSAYEVEGDTTLERVPLDSAAQRCRPPLRLTIQVGEARDDSAAIRRQQEARRRRVERRAAGDSGAVRADSSRRAARERCLARFEVAVPTDSAALLASEHLPASIYSTDAELITIDEIESLGRELERLPEAPWQLRPPRLQWGLGAAGLLRYNRIEGLSIGARTDLELGRLTAALTGRIGVADIEPNAELALVRETPATQLRLAAYRRLAAANPETKPLATGNSFSALLLGRDDGEYFRAAGVEFTMKPSITSTQWYEWRLYAERQWRADVETDFSLRHLIDGDHTFRPNLAAREADQIGALLKLRTSNGLDPAGFRWGAELAIEGAAGTFDFAKPGLTLRVAARLPAALLGALEVAGGTTAGESPVQGQWFLGGPATLRGYAGAAAHGEAFWRARTELSTQLPAARVVLFSDAGWAGTRTDLAKSRPLVSAGAGASFFDGLIRFDIARALRHPLGWRADLYVNGSL